MPLVCRVMLALGWACSAAANPTAGVADPVGAPPVVAVVLSKEAEPYRLTEKGLRSTLARRGAVLTTLVLGPQGPGPDRVESAQIIVGVGTEAAQWAQANAPEGAEIVYCMVSDPAGAGLGQGRIAHGVSAEIPVAEQVSLLRQALPGVTHVGTLYNAKSPRGAGFLEAFRNAAPTDWTIHAIDTSTKASTSEAIAALMARKPDVVWTIPDSTVFDLATVRTLLGEAIRSRVPVFGFSVAFVRAGAALGVGIEPEPHGVQAGELALRVWEERERRGRALPAALTMPPRFQTAVNLSVAEQIGVQIPEAVRRQADMLIKGGK